MSGSDAGIGIGACRKANRCTTGAMSEDAPIASVVAFMFGIADHRSNSHAIPGNASGGADPRGRRDLVKQIAGDGRLALHDAGPHRVTTLSCTSAMPHCRLASETSRRPGVGEAYKDTGAAGGGEGAAPALLSWCARIRVPVDSSARSQHLTSGSDGGAPAGHRKSADVAGARRSDQAGPGEASLGPAQVLAASLDLGGSLF